jgi:polysaccharide export outer membrane protein
VTVQEMAPHKVTVSGAVTEAGVFKFDEPATLSEAVAMAKGATHTANLHRVAIVRTVEGQRVAGVFDLAAIAAGRSADPAIRENDVIVVDDSRSKVFWREFVQVLPFLYVFTAL